MVTKKVETSIKSVLQEKVWNRLHKIYLSSQISNAYIFSGPPGSGKENLAIEFSKLLNCKNPSSYGCNHCPSCTRFLKLQHENLKLIFPLPAPSKKSGSSVNTLDGKNVEIVTELINKKSVDLFFKIKVPGATRILINSIRELRKSLYLKSENSGKKIVLIFDAHLLSMGQGEAANALLKLLEEPPENTSFILVTDQINLLLPTILSRCQSIIFPKLKDQVIEAWFSSKRIHKEDISFFTGLSNGNVHQAAFLNSYKKKDLIDLINNLLNIIINKNPDQWRTFFQTYSKLSKDDFMLFSFHLTLIKIWFQGANRLQNNIDHILHHTQLKMGMERFIRLYDCADYSLIISEFDELTNAVKQNLFMPLVLTNFLLKIQKNINNQ